MKDKLEALNDKLEKSNIRKKYMYFIIVIELLVIVMNFSYAIFTSNYQKKGVLSIQGASIKVKEQILDNGKEDGITLYPGSTSTVSFKLTNESGFDVDYRLVAYTKENDISFIVSSTNDVSGSLSVADEKTFSVTVTNDSANSKNFYLKGQYKIAGRNYEELSGNFQFVTKYVEPNAPSLVDGMIAVYYDEDSSSWKKADTSNSNWYNYKTGKWANAVTVNQNASICTTCSDNITKQNRVSYQGASAGTPISMDDINGMYVWIPRFKYKIWNPSTTTTSTPRLIEVVFENNTSVTGDCSTSSPTLNCMYNHPAFTFNNLPIKGFWYGKFEVSGSSSALKVIPDVQSLRSTTIGSFFWGARAMELSNNMYGFGQTSTSTSVSNTGEIVGDSNNFDTHISKNNEWGAVSYLAESLYGICADKDKCNGTEVYINNSSGYYTGRSGGNNGGLTAINKTYPSQTLTTQYNTYGFYTYDGYLLDYNTNIKSSTNDLDKVASTTGNIYGIYDMSGGAHEMVMGNYSTTSSLTTTTSYFTDYATVLPRYYDLYSMNTISSCTFEKCAGAGLYETRWFGDSSNFVSSTNPWFYRGYYYKYGDYSGLFASHYGAGSINGGVSSRVAITPQ